MRLKLNPETCSINPKDGRKEGTKRDGTNKKQSKMVNLYHFVTYININDLNTLVKRQRLSY